MNITTILPPSHHEVSKITFSWFDYTLFSGMLGLSVLIGIYFGFCVKKQNTKEEYLLGGKSMSILPVALSLVASHISGITILAVPADVYKFGSNYWWLCMSMIIICILISYLYLPVFFKLQFTSMYEYLETRFDKKVRVLASFIFTLAIFMYNPVVIYIPALAFSQATGINLHLITPIVCVVCIFYTTVGGLKAVIWTDALQFAGIIGSSIAIFFMGAASAGGFGRVWEKAVEGQRLDMFDFRFDPTLRDGFWALIIGGTFHWLSIAGLNQGSMQKFLAVPTLAHARKSIVIYCIGMIIMKSLSVFTGDIIYAKYADCDPMSSKQVTRSDQLLPYFVIDVAGKLPGLPGIFIAGIFSAALSTLSATLNTVSGTIYEDFISPFVSAKVTQQQASNILKLIVVISGTVCTALVFVIEKMGGLLPFVVAFQGVTGGPLLGLFTMGILLPMVNSTGALVGGIISLSLMSWITFMKQWYMSQGVMQDFSKPMSVEGCDFYVNITQSKPFPIDVPSVIFRISFWYNTLMGAFITVIVGLVVSWIVKKDDAANPDLVHPAVQFLLPERQRKKTLYAAYYTVEKAMHVVEVNSDKEKT